MLLNVVAVHQVARQKLNGPMTHFGVAVQFVDGFGRTFVDVYDKNVNGHRRVSLDEFAQDRDVNTTSSVSDVGGIRKALARLRRECSMNEPYHITTNNCEHFANSVVHGERRSFQVEHALIAGFAIGAVLLLTNAKGA